MSICLRVCLLGLPISLVAGLTPGCHPQAANEAPAEAVSQAGSSPWGGALLTEATLFAPGVVSSPEGDEFAVTFMPDARTAFFTSKREAEQPYTIYTTHYEDGRWSTPEVAPFSGEHFDADAFVAPDGSQLFFFSMRPTTGTTPLEAPDIWVVDRDATGWGPAKNLGPPVNTAEAGEGYVTVTRDGTLYFSSVGRNDATGTHDIYRARRIDGTYAAPEYLDLAISMQFSNPYIAPDERLLLVDSKQPGGYGGGDLYVSYNRNGRWSTPQNLGPLVNTAGEEGTPGLSPDGRFLFFSRDGDIYYISVEAIDALQKTP